MNLNGLKLLRQAIHEQACKSGFWDEQAANIGMKLSLIHAEVSELTEAVRKKELENSEKLPDFLEVEEEAADIIIRVLDLCEQRDWRIEEAMLAKALYNQTRKYKHGKVF